MFIISLDYQVPLEQVDQFVPEHIDYLNKHYAEGHFILSGRKEPRTGGVNLSTVSDRSELNDILALDPFYREGLATYEITEMVPSKSTESLKFLL